MDASQFDYLNRTPGKHPLRRSAKRTLVVLGTALLPGNCLLRAVPVATTWADMVCGSPAWRRGRFR